MARNVKNNCTPPLILKSKFAIGSYGHFARTVYKLLLLMKIPKELSSKFLYFSFISINLNFFKSAAIIKYFHLFFDAVEQTGFPTVVSLGGIGVR